MSESAETTPSKPDKKRWLALYLRFVGITSLFAFGAAVMPESWMTKTAAWLGLELPSAPLTFYLARNLSLMYGFVGAGLMVLANDLDRYFDLVRLLSFATMAFGVTQLICNAQAGMPIWWTAGEGGGAIAGGATMWWLHRMAK